MSLQILSDLHLEMISDFNFPVKAKYLALLGDIGYPFENHYKNFIHKQSNRFEIVFVLAGNHEFYTSEYHSVIKRIQNVCDTAPKKNVYFLNRNVFVLNKTKIIGATLWSNIELKNVVKLTSSVNDYRKIKLNDNLLSVKDTNEFHKQDLEFIKNEIDKSRELKQECVLLTHHAPYHKGTSDPRYEIPNRPLNQAFSTDLSNIMIWPLKYACFGHTHYRCNFKLGDTQIISNALGYRNEIDEKLNDVVIEL